MQDAARVFAQGGRLLALAGEHYGTDILCRGNLIRVKGSEEKVYKSLSVIEEILSDAKRGIYVSERQMLLIMKLFDEGKMELLHEMKEDIINLTRNGEAVRPRTLGQKMYVDAIRRNSITFGVGPAGTGKTYLAVALGAFFLKNHDVRRIILVRPAVEAGEKLGFLPGDLQSKIDPYLRPLYDALYQIMGAESFLKNSEKGLIEVAPLAYMRGRTLDNAFIILDEAQNTTPAQMKMFLTRIGFGSKVVVTGDATQKDLPKGTTSGLDVALKVLKKVEGISICELTNSDVVRHPLVQKIVQAYDAYEKRESKDSKNKRKRTRT